MKIIKNSAIFLTTCLFFFVLAGCGSSKTINLNDYVSVTYSGDNGNGHANIDFDVSQFTEDCSKIIKVNKSALSQNEDFTLMDGLSNADYAEFVYYEYIDIDASSYTDLSNGDTVEYKWDCNDDFVKKAFGLKLKHSDFSEKVEGLGESIAPSEDEESGSTETLAATEVDPFDKLVLKYDGIDGSGSASIESSQYNGVKYSIQPDSGLSNGEEVIVTVDSGDTFFANNNMTPSVTEKKYKVEGLPHYIREVSEVPAEIFEAMDKQLQDNLTAEFSAWDLQASRMGNGKYEKLVSMDLVANYVLTLKDGMTGNPYNYIYFIYKITANNDAAPNDFEYYWYGEYSNISVLDNGQCTVDLDKYITANSLAGAGNMISFEEHNGHYYYQGFKDLDSAYEKLVASKGDKYDYTEEFRE